MKCFATLVLSVVSFVSFGQFKFSKPFVVDFYEDSLFFSKNKIDHILLNQHVLDEVNMQRKMNNVGSVRMSNDTSRTIDCNQWNKKLLDTMYLIHDYDYLNNSHLNNCVGEICIGLNYTKSDYDSNIYVYISKDVVRRWMDSPSHKKIMLKSNDKDIVLSFNFKEPSSKSPSVIGICTMRFFE
jgi:uncharacterized protein YkwD